MLAKKRTIRVFPQFYSMISLQKINIKFANKTFQPHTKKYFKLSADSYIKKLNNPAKFINENTLEWQQPIALPFGLNKHYSFQLISGHQFGYNPEELSHVFSGKITIPGNTKKTSFSWQVFNDKNQKVGFLSADLRKKVDNQAKKELLLNSIVNLPSTMEMSGSIKVSSIITHLPAIRGKVAFVELKSSNSTLRTEAIRSRAGELVFIEELQMKKSQLDSTIEVLLHQKGETQSTIVAKGKWTIDPDLHKSRIILCNSQNQQIGQMYIESKFCHKTSKGSRIESKVRYGIDSLVFKNISHISTTNLNRQKTPTLSDSSKKISVVNSNNDIRFSKEKRFTDYTDRKSDYVSYLDNRNFEFKEKHSNKFYRGASIGRGDKHDFTHFVKFNPGVGQYKLPSIWDRY